MGTIKLQQLSKQYDNKHYVIEDLNLEIEDGEFLVLIGPSGCGKSTVLRMIAGLEGVTEGNILFDDQIMTKYTPAERNIAMVFQNYALYPHKTVFENIAFNLRKKKKFTNDQITKLVLSTAKLLKVDKLLKRRPKHLSGGQRQRVALARAIVREPNVFLFDEPLSNLDAKLRTSTRTELAKLHNRLKTTMIYVTHDQTEAMTLATKIAVMKEGKILQLDTPMNIYDNPANLFVATFIGTPPMNIIRASIEDGNDALAIKINNISIPLTDLQTQTLQKYDEKEVLIGIRPEDFYVTDTNDTSIAVEIEMIENMGSEQFVYCSIDHHQITITATSDRNLQMGELLPISFEIQNVKFFDINTEENLLIN
ncbi:ABC transporter ATP-binding protein [Gracilibacillus sp. HCP3S3_G5_1]|uniref:ABC transporter ATP-binding protein n=1 Tax=unclassified Gracilibacillus TaxID=2625209 RepID=UPI003F8AEEEF